MLCSAVQCCAASFARSYPNRSMDSRRIGLLPWLSMKISSVNVQVQMYLVYTRACYRLGLEVWPTISEVTPDT